MRPIKPASEMTRDELAAYIDYSVLKPEFTTQDVKREARTAADLHCKTVCINPAYIETVLPIVEGTDTGTCRRQSRMRAPSGRRLSAVA